MLLQGSKNGSIAEAAMPWKGLKPAGQQRQADHGQHLAEALMPWKGLKLALVNMESNQFYIAEALMPWKGLKRCPA